MDEQQCRFCDNKQQLIRIFDTDGLKQKIELCLPIIVFQEYNIPDTVCTKCVDKIDKYVCFIHKCLENILLLEQQYNIVDSCIKEKRKVDQAVLCEVIDLPIKLLDIPEIETLDFDVTTIKVQQLVDYPSSDEDEATTIIDEIVQRKCLKRKITSPIVAPPTKMAKTEESSSRRKSSKPKRVEYQLEFGNQQVCLLCDSTLPNMIQLSAHMFEIHGIDFSQVYSGGTETIDAPAPKKKMPELVKISDVINLGKLPAKLTVEVVGQQPYNSSFNTQVDDTLEITQITEPPPPIVESSKPTMSSLSDSLFVCSECPENRKPFTCFSEFSTHRRAQHQIFHCDLCPKFYGRNSHLWKHVNRVHKGHSAITCNQCGKTSASEYHLQQHKNKMHAAQQQIATSTTIDTKPQLPPEPVTEEMNDEMEEENDAILSDEDDLLNQKFQGFDFKSVKQSFLRQELMDKRNRYVSVLKKNNVFDDDMIKTEKKEKTPPPKEIDSTSDLYTTIITNYTPPTNEGPFKCPKCLKGFHKKNLVKKHKKNCRPRLQKDLLTRCKTCSRIFKDRQSLAKHLVNYHSEYTCEICALAVQSKCEIVSHIRFTHPNSELQCYCGQILRSKADLNKHKAEHRDSFVCQFCGDMLPTKIKLKMHILSLHRKILALSCGICLKLFETQHILRAHVKFAHADELKPLTSCTVCGKNYGSKWKTFDHLNKSHGRIFKACKICLEVFESERDLQQHFDKEHINSSNNGSQTSMSSAKITNVPSLLQNSGQKKNAKKSEDKVTSRLANMSDNEQEFDDFDYMEAKNGKNNTSLLEKRLLNKDKYNEEQDLLLEMSTTARQNFESSFTSKKKLNLLEKRLVTKDTRPPALVLCSSLDTDLNNSSDEMLSKRPFCDTSFKDELSQSAPQNSSKTQSFNTSNPDLSQSNDDILQNSSKRTVYVNSNDPSLCEICLKTWPAKKHLWQHYIRCHKSTAATVCGICLKTNPSYSALQRHLRDTHPKLLYGQGFGSNFICKICGRYHNASSKLRLHMAIHVGYNAHNETEDAPNIDDDDNKDEINELEVKTEMIEDDFEQENSPKEDNIESNTRSSNSDNDEQENDESDASNDDTNSDSDNDDDTTSEMSDQDTKTEIKQEILEDDVYYESLIEEIEASSEDETHQVNEGSVTSGSQSPNLEQEMLRNMMCESKSQRLMVKSEPMDVEEEMCDELDENEQQEDIQNGDDVDEYEYEIEIKDEPEHEDELNSAIQSICSSTNVGKEEMEDDDEMGYKRIHRVNESELAKAVGSIL